MCSKCSPTLALICSFGIGASKLSSTSLALIVCPSGVTNSGDIPSSNVWYMLLPAPFKDLVACTALSTTLSPILFPVSIKSSAVFLMPLLIFGIFVGANTSPVNQAPSSASFSRSPIPLLPTGVFLSIELPRPSSLKKLVTSSLASKEFVKKVSDSSNILLSSAKNSGLATLGAICFFNSFGMGKPLDAYIFTKSNMPALLLYALPTPSTSPPRPTEPVYSPPVAPATLATFCLLASGE